VKKGNSGAENYGLDIEDHLVNKIGRKEGLRQFTTAEERNAFSLIKCRTNSR